jgi:hypothetical protein
MNIRGLSKACSKGITILLLICVLPCSARADVAIGPRAGYDFDTDNFVLGMEAELDRVLQNFKLAPSLDFELGDNSSTALNADFRLYLFNLPETGLHFYGSIGPTLFLNNQNELGLSLVAGMKIPMNRRNRYNLEARFGIGDIPDLKLMLSILFGI